jgi:hypothetical protein
VKYFTSEMRDMHMAVRGIVTALPACSPPDHILPEEDEVNGSDSRGQSPRPPTAASEGQERPARRRECRPRGQANALPKSGTSAVEMIRQIKGARDTAVKGRPQAMQAMNAIIVSAPAARREQLEACQPTPQILTHREYPGCSRM